MKNLIENAILVHKLKHGLSTIKWSLKMLVSGDFGEVNEEEKKIIKKSLEENERLILLADSLLDENGPERGKKFLDKKLCGLEQIIESAIELHSIKIKEKKIKLDFIRPKEKIEAFLDKEKISIAIQNILDNAVKYTGQGGKITIYLEKSGNNLQLKIQDSGIGILEKEKKNMFAKFFRGANVPKANGGDGSGLGLFIAKNIIEAHEGKIWFESKENVGSTFYISLPLKI